MTQSWRVGGVSLSRVEESERPGSMPPESFFAGFERRLFERHLDWLVPHHYSTQHERLMISCHSWLVRADGLTVLLDCCAGNHKYRPFNPAFHQLDTPYLERLAAAGVAPEEVDVVLCTHLHADHVGWNTRLDNGRWIPTFPNARYLFSESENAYWQAQVATVLKENAGRRAVYEDSVLPVIEAGQARLLDGAHRLSAELLIEPAPGHTPGHIVLKIASAGEHGLCCGDAIHHPVQLYHPEWNTQFCVDQELARQTRRCLLDYCVDTPALLFPAHFARPFVARIERRDPAYAPVFVPPMAE
ncbi:MAG: MBL fold metallo-hydrolase [Burkholderiales bacterium]|nr:MBL fold metallo-hydrolase [Burkholderiales bacterium]